MRNYQHKDLSVVVHLFHFFLNMEEERIYQCLSYFFFSVIPKVFNEGGA